MKDFAQCCTVIAEGEVISDGLRRLGRDDHWLQERLQRQGIMAAEEVFWGISDGEEVELHMIL